MEKMLKPLVKFLNYIKEETGDDCAFAVSILIWATVVINFGTILGSCVWNIWHSEGATILVVINYVLICICTLPIILTKVMNMVDNYGE